MGNVFCHNNYSRIKTMYQQKSCSSESANRSFTLIELFIVILVIGILAGMAAFAFSTFTKRAHDIVARHDLEKFIQAEKSYYKVKSQYFGVSGDFIEGALTDPFNQAGFNFSSSAGVRIAIVAGDGTEPKSHLRIEAGHRKGTLIYTYDFATGKITQRTKE
jgi:Tfp pilus assembly protein PilE